MIKTSNSHTQKYKRGTNEWAMCLEQGFTDASRSLTFHLWKGRRNHHTIIGQKRPQKSRGKLICLFHIPGRKSKKMFSISFRKTFSNDRKIIQKVRKK